MRDFDLLVIGSGPAGEKGAVQAAYFGKRVAVVERAPVPGGASANTGTLPSKTLRETALALSGFKQRGFRAVEVTHDANHTLDDFLHREKFVMEHERARILANLEDHGVELIGGDASFVDANTLKITARDGSTRTVTADVILIATGSSPHRPAQFPFEDDRVFDSDEIVNLHMMPSTMVIAGGGVIGCEYACLFAALGVHVTLLEQKERLMGFLDHEVIDRLTTTMREVLRIDVRLGSSIQKLALPSIGCDLELSGGERLHADAVLIASGRTGNTKSLNLEAVGLKATSRGHLEVDQNYRTARSNIYAAGDVIGFPALGSTSMEQGRIAVVHAFDLKYKTALAPILPYGIYTIPECSMAGDTEEQLIAAKVPYVVGRAEFAHNARGTIVGEQHGFLKLLFREADMRLLGVHVLGEQATELVHIGLTGLLTGATADLFIQTCFNYPTLSEAYKYAAYDALEAATNPSR